MNRYASTALVCIGLGVPTLINRAALDPKSLARNYFAPPQTSVLKPEVARWLSLGFRDAVADWYWIRAANYIGDERNEQVGFATLPQLVEVSIQLAPRFTAPYRYGGMMIAQSYADGHTLHVPEAISVLKRGVAQFPDDVWLGLLLALHYSLYSREFGLAAAELERIAKLPGAPTYAAPLAARLLAADGNLEGAETLTGRLMQGVEDPVLLARLAARRAEIETERGIQLVERAIQEFKRQQGRLPTSLDELTQLHLLEGLPPLPEGGTWRFDAATGVVSTSITARRLNTLGEAALDHGAGSRQ